MQKFIATTFLVVPVHGFSRVIAFAREVARVSDAGAVDLKDVAVFVFALPPDKS